MSLWIWILCLSLLGYPMLEYPYCKDKKLDKCKSNIKTLEKWLDEHFEALLTTFDEVEAVKRADLAILPKSTPKSADSLDDFNQDWQIERLPGAAYDQDTGRVLETPKCHFCERQARINTFNPHEKKNIKLCPSCFVKLNEEYRKMTGGASLYSFKSVIRSSDNPFDKTYLPKVHYGKIQPAKERGQK